MTAALTLFVQGPLRVSVAGRSDEQGLSRRGQALLAFLSQQPGLRAERAQLADLLWSDRSEEQARASLRQELSVLRKALPDGILKANRQMVWLDAGRIRVDASGTGDFLQGFDLPSEGFEDWLRQTRSAQGRPSSHAPAATTMRNRPSLAVLPFDELGVADSDMFADGVVEEITGALSRVHDFHVIARQSAYALRGERIDIPHAAERLGADYILEGAVRRADDRVRISVQLVDGADGRTLWAGRFDDHLDDLFELQDRIAAQIAGQVSPNVRAAEIARVSTRPPEDRTAYELTLSALPHFWASRKDTLLTAIDLLNAAISRKPDYAPALAYKAWAVAHLPTYMWSDTPEGDHDLACALAAEAVNHAGEHAPTLVAIGAAFSFSSRDGELGLGFIDRALEIDPNNAWGWLRRGWSLVAIGQGAEAFSALDRAELLSPLDPFRFSLHVCRAAAFRQTGDYDAAIDLLYQAMRENPGTPWIRRSLVLTLLGAGRDEQAHKEAALMLRDYPGLTLQRFLSSFPRAFWTGNTAHVEAIRQIGLPEA